MELSPCLTQTNQFVDLESSSCSEGNSRGRYSSRIAASLKNVKNIALEFILPAGLFIIGLAGAYFITDFCKHQISSKISSIGNPSPTNGIERHLFERESKSYGVAYGALGGIVSGPLIGAGPAMFKGYKIKQIILISAAFGCLVGATIGAIYSLIFLSQNDMIKK